MICGEVESNERSCSPFRGDVHRIEEVQDETQPTQGHFQSKSWEILRIHGQLEKN